MTLWFWLRRRQTDTRAGLQDRHRKQKQRLQMTMGHLSSQMDTILDQHEVDARTVANREPCDVMHEYEKHIKDASHHVQMHRSQSKADLAGRLEAKRAAMHKKVATMENLLHEHDKQINGEFIKACATDPTLSVLIHGLPKNVAETDIAAPLGQFGTVADVHIRPVAENKEGWALVVFQDTAVAAQAVQAQRVPGVGWLVSVLSEAEVAVEYEAVQMVKLRQAVELDSGPTGFLQQGQHFQALLVRHLPRDGGGTSVRVCSPQGWGSLQSSNGNELLRPVALATKTAPMPPPREPGAVVEESMEVSEAESVGP